MNDSNELTRETASEKVRRERRSVALTALNHLLNVAVKPYAGDRHSEQDLCDAARKASLCIGEFENEANQAEADRDHAREELATLKAKLEAEVEERIARQAANARLRAELARLQPYVQHLRDCSLINDYTRNGNGQWMDFYGKIVESVSCSCGLIPVPSSQTDTA